MKTINIILICLVSLLLLAGSANAVAFGASPATLSFEFPKGGSDEQILTVSTASEQPIDVAISVSDEIKDFISYSPSSNLKTDVKNPLEIKVLAKASRFARSGIYAGTITASTVPSDANTEGTGSAIATAVAIKTNVKIGQTATSTTQEANTEPTASDVTPKVQNTVPLSSGGSGSTLANTLVIFVIIIIIGCLVLVAVKLSKRKRK